MTPAMTQSEAQGTKLKSITIALSYQRFACLQTCTIFLSPGKKITHTDLLTEDNFLHEQNYTFCYTFKFVFKISYHTRQQGRDYDESQKIQLFLSDFFDIILVLSDC